MNPGRGIRLPPDVIEFGGIAAILHATSRRHCERSEAIHLADCDRSMDCFVATAMHASAQRRRALAMTETLMLTKAPHLFDDATQVTAGDSCWQGKTSPDYWAFVGPFGGCTAATILRALIDHPQRAGDPLSLTVNFCAPVAEGAFDLDVRLVKANRSSQHWCVEMTQGGGDVATLATAVFAERRPSWSHQQATFPGADAVRAGALVSEHADDLDAPV